MERLLALRSLPARELVLCLPPFGVETKSAYGSLAEARRGPPLAAPAPLSLGCAVGSWAAGVRV